VKSLLRVEPVGIGAGREGSVGGGREYSGGVAEAHHGGPLGVVRPPKGLTKNLKKYIIILI
jgi:hypothetical protein